MATSPSHKLGQIIGDMVEAAIITKLSKFAADNNLYIDFKGSRPARSGKKVSWVDSFGNKHDLDFVLERGGTEETIGTPVAFIESAWRRYTKHSRNKAQEIQGAILPLVNTHKNHAPFKGVILAGVFTEGAITQLTSLGFGILYFTYDSVIDAFASYGIDVNFDEDTPEIELQEKVKACTETANMDLIADRLIEINSKEVDTFLESLQIAVSRYINSIVVIPLHGGKSELATVQDAINFISDYSNTNANIPVLKYEISIRYNNGDMIDAVFHDKQTAIDFLGGYSLDIQPANEAK